MSARDQRLALAEVVVGWGDGTAIPDLPGFLESATDAVRPLIEADLRERLAAAIEARAWQHAQVVGDTQDAPATNNPEQRGRDHGIQIAYLEAARIVRERP